MTSQTVQLHHRVHEKALELGISADVILNGLNIICRNHSLVNAMDHTVETDDYIYRAILKQAFEKRKAKAEANLYAEDPNVQREASRDLTMLRREELTSDAFYRAVLPLMVKVLVNEPILRLHAEEASTIVLQLADYKRRLRATSLTEIIVKRCAGEINEYLKHD